jgi:hypothetical protein
MTYIEIEEEIDQGRVEEDIANDVNSDEEWFLRKDLNR